ncbi:hypothetical protein [Streptomyces pseudovenezuelae]|uniref:Uncharacterized protein n=1 Tax=Streptomyces pseudovenezuelae TaxID=67350 RepID=A0ABT6M2C8_9ACTN|nr:hypothetical protein [Streptomyces pseudovenezuelae]MDH6222280.1 hypothetical protein [Streptomyces pseudovenezuelae]
MATRPKSARSQARDSISLTTTITPEGLGHWQTERAGIPDACTAATSP